VQAAAAVGPVAAAVLVCLVALNLDSTSMLCFGCGRSVRRGCGRERGCARGRCRGRQRREPGAGDPSKQQLRRHRNRPEKAAEIEGTDERTGGGDGVAPTAGLARVGDVGLAFV
jgi:hypothetical protein